MCSDKNGCHGKTHTFITKKHKLDCHWAINFWHISTPTVPNHILKRHATQKVNPINQQQNSIINIKLNLKNDCLGLSPSKQAFSKCPLPTGQMKGKKCH